MKVALYVAKKQENIDIVIEDTDLSLEQYIDSYIESKGYTKYSSNVKGNVLRSIVYLSTYSKPTAENTLGLLAFCTE